MTTLSCRQTVKNILTTLGECKYISIDEASISDGLENEYLDTIEQGLNIQLGNSLRSVYNQIGSVDIRWHVALSQYPDLKPLYEEDVYISGSIHFLDPYTMILGKDGNYWKDILWFDDINSETNDRLKNFKPIDFQNSENVIGIVLENNLLSNSFMLYTSSDGLFDLQLDIDQYFSLIQETLGFIYWPIALTQSYSEEREKLIYYLGQLFHGKSLISFGS